MIKFVKDRAALLSAMAKIAVTGPPRSAFPITANMLFNAGPEGLRLAVTDLEVYAEASFPATVESEGSITLPQKAFTEVAKNAPGQELSFTEIDNNRVELRSGSFKATLFGLSAVDFPQKPSSEGRPPFVVEPSLLRDAIGKTIFSVIDGDNTYNLSGVFMFKEDGLLGLVSTDTQRLNVVKFAPLEGEPSFQEESQWGIIVPARGVRALLKCAEGGNPLSLSCSKSHLLCETPGQFLSVRLLDGPFPDYRAVLPKEESPAMAIKREGFMEALRRGSLLAGKNSASKFVFQPGQLTVSSANPELGESSETLTIDYSGPEITAGYNPRYFLEALSAMASEEIRLAPASSDVMMVMTGDSDPDYSSLIVSCALKE
jgi:DNA polymerase-3 subunit beta